MSTKRSPDRRERSRLEFETHPTRRRVGRRRRTGQKRKGHGPSGALRAVVLRYVAPVEEPVAHVVVGDLRRDEHVVAPDEIRIGSDDRRIDSGCLLLALPNHELLRDTPSGHERAQDTILVGGAPRMRCGFDTLADCASTRKRDERIARSRNRSPDRRGRAGRDGRTPLGTRQVEGGDG